VNGTPLVVEPGTTAAVAAFLAGVPSRISVSGQLRTPLCGMGICFECRMKIDGVAHSRSCQIPVAPGMKISTDE
jgi:hypothetical protein